MENIIKKRTVCILITTILIVLAFGSTVNADIQKPGSIKGLRCSVRSSGVTTSVVASWNRADRAKGYEVKYIATYAKGISRTYIANTTKTNHSISFSTKKMPQKLVVKVRAFNYYSFRNGLKQYGPFSKVTITFKRPNLYMMVFG